MQGAPLLVCSLIANYLWKHLADILKYVLLICQLFLNVIKLTVVTNGLINFALDQMDHISIYDTYILMHILVYIDAYPSLISL